MIKKGTLSFAPVFRSRASQCCWKAEMPLCDPRRAQVSCCFVYPAVCPEAPSPWSHTNLFRKLFVVAASDLFGEEQPCLLLMRDLKLLQWKEGGVGAMVTSDEYSQLSSAASYVPAAGSRPSLCTD